MLWHNQVRSIGIVWVLAALERHAERTRKIVGIDLKAHGRPGGVDGDIRQELVRPVIARTSEDARDLIGDADRNELPSRCEYRHRKEQCAGKYEDGSEYQSSSRADADKQFR